MLIKFFLDKMDPKKPVYSTSKISDVRKSPDAKHPMYGALRGPNANEMCVSRYRSAASGEWRVVCDEPHKLWRDFEPLYMHHGKR